MTSSALLVVIKLSEPILFEHKSRKHLICVLHRLDSILRDMLKSWKGGLEGVANDSVNRGRAVADNGSSVGVGTVGASAMEKRITLSRNSDTVLEVTLATLALFASTRTVVKGTTSSCNSQARGVGVSGRLETSCLLGRLPLKGRLLNDKSPGSHIHLQLS
jgi:hypothetical protein